MFRTVCIPPLQMSDHQGGGAEFRRAVYGSGGHEAASCPQPGRGVGGGRPQGALQPRAEQDGWVDARPFIATPHPTWLTVEEDRWSWTCLSQTCTWRTSSLESAPKKASLWCRRRVQPRRWWMGRTCWGPSLATSAWTWPSRRPKRSGSAGWSLAVGSVYFKASWVKSLKTIKHNRKLTVS